MNICSDKNSFLLIVLLNIVFSCCSHDNKSFANSKDNGGFDKNRPEKDSIELDLGFGSGKYPITLIKEYDSLFSYNYLSCKNIEFKDLNIECYEKTSKEDKYRINIKKNIEFIYNQQHFNKLNDNYLTCCNKKISISSLLNDSMNNINNNYFLSNAYIFDFKESEYVLLIFDIIMTNSTTQKNQGFLFQLKNNTIDKVIKLPTSQTTDSPYNINDFDNDGYLDFASWDPYTPYNNKLQLYSLKNDKFFINNKFYLTLFPISEGAYYIDYNKSFWFCPIKECRKKYLHEKM